MGTETNSLHEQALRRVHQRYERERAELVKQSLADRRELVRAHKEKFERLSVLEEDIKASKKDALSQHAQDWERERMRMANSTSRAPAFGLLGPPVRNIQKEYNDRRERWEAKRESIKELFDENLGLVRHQRQEICNNHNIALTHSTHREHRDLAEMKRRHENSFDAAVKREEARGSRRLGRTFEQHARDTGHER